MKGVLLDSDVIIEILRGRDREISDKWEDLASSDLLIGCSPITIAEVWSGARDREEKQTESLFGSIVCMEIDAEIGFLAGKLKRRFAKSHDLDIADVLIGATAIARDMTLWTRNRKHYPMSGLTFYGSPFH